MAGKLSSHTHTRFIGYSGWSFEEIRKIQHHPSAIEKCIIAKFMQTDFDAILRGRGRTLPPNCLHVVVSGEHALGGVAMNPEEPISDFRASNAVPESLIPVVAGALAKACKLFEEEMPGQKFMISVNSTFYHADTDGRMVNVEHGGKVMQLLSNINIICTSDQIFLVNKWEAANEDNMGNFLLKSEYERLNKHPIKKVIDAKIHELKGYTEGLVGIISFICVDIAQNHNIDWKGITPDTVIVTVTGHGVPAFENWKVLQKLAIWLVDSKYPYKTGLYELVPDATEWKELQSESKLANSGEISSLIKAFSQGFCSGKKFIDMPRGGGVVKVKNFASHSIGDGYAWVIESEIRTFKKVEQAADGTVVKGVDGKLGGKESGRLETLPSSGYDRLDFAVKDPHFVPNIEPGLEVKPEKKLEDGGRIEQSENLGHIDGKLFARKLMVSVI